MKIQFYAFGQSSTSYRSQCGQLPLEDRLFLYQCPMDAITKCHTMNSLTQIYSLTVLEVRSLKLNPSAEL
jgi:hypothetical protein